MSNILLVDFGASRIKAAVWSISKSQIINSIECESPTPHFGVDGEVEINPEDYWSCLEKTAGKLIEVHSDITDLWICSEMHGFLLYDNGKRVPISPYISWRDERASKSFDGESSTYNQFGEEFRSNFLEETGLKFRIGLPFLTLAHLKLRLTPNVRICTLVDWILYRGGETNPKVHASLAAGTGLYSLKTKNWPNQISIPTLPEISNIHLSPISKNKEPIGKIQLNDRPINVYGGIGDLQAAVLGAGFPNSAPLLINLGTGSQVIGIAKNVGVGVEFRPDAYGEYFAALSHIPSGRALNVFAKFIDSCAVSSGGNSLFWEIFQSLTENEILGSPINVDLNVFEASWLYSGGGSISGISETGLSVKTLIGGLVKSWLSQYVFAMNLIDPSKVSKTFLVSGGLSRRNQFILPVLESLSGKTGALVTPITGEETLDGLLALALKFHAA